MKFLAIMAVSAVDNLFNLKDSPPPIQLHQEPIKRTEDGLPDDTDLLGRLEHETENDEK